MGWISSVASSGSNSPASRRSAVFSEARRKLPEMPRIRTSGRVKFRLAHRCNRLRWDAARPDVRVIGGINHRSTRHTPHTKMYGAPAMHSGQCCVFADKPTGAAPYILGVSHEGKQVA